MLKPGGHVVYATCSIDQEENDDVTAWASASAGYELIRQALVLPAGLPGEAMTSYRDGGYAALLRLRTDIDR